MKTVKYTEQAQKKLSSLQEQYKDDLEREILSKKFYPGDDEIEITQSDLEEASHNFKLVRPVRTSSKYLIIIVYFFFGVLTAFIGLYYQDIIRIRKENPVQAMLIIAGATMTFLSAIMYFYFKLRDKQRESYEKYKNEVDIISKSINLK